MTAYDQETVRRPGPSRGHVSTEWGSAKRRRTIPNVPICHVDHPYNSAAGGTQPLVGRAWPITIWP
jgi:hypothetical protein